MTEIVFKPAVTGAKQSKDGRVKFTPGNHQYRMDKKPVPSTTTFQKAIVPKDALMHWSAKVVAQKVWDEIGQWVKAGMSPDDLPFMIQSMQELGEERFVSMLKNEPWEKRDNAAEQGTQIHEKAEQLAQFFETDVPESIAGYVDAYLDFEADWHPVNRIVEVVVGSFDRRTVGLLDELCHLPKLRSVINEKTRKPFCEHDYECVSIVDTKTGSGVYGDTFWQLGDYCFADWYIDADGEYQPMPKVEHAFVRHLGPDGYSLIPFDIDFENDKELIMKGRDVAETNLKRLKTVMGDPLPIPKAD